MNTAVTVGPTRRFPRSAAQSDTESRIWRGIWRTHFYAGILSAPVLVVFAITGLVILYTDPIQSAVHRNLRTVSSSSIADANAPRRSLEDQRVAVEKAFPAYSVAGVTPPRNVRATTKFALSPKSGEGAVRHAFVNPVSGEVLGSMKEGDDVVGLANRLHASLNNESFKVPIPSLPAFALTSDAVVKRIPVGRLLLEIVAGWLLVLAISGVYLWWPRKHRASANQRGIAAASGTSGTSRTITKRARWRQLHSLPGLVLSWVLLFFVVTGMPWSPYWGSGWRTVSGKLTPRASIDQPSSVVQRTGALDRFGNKIPWVTQETPVPASQTPATPGEPDGSSAANVPSGHNDSVSHRHAPTVGGTQATVLTLDDVARVAQQEKLAPGYSIALPVDETKMVGSGETTYTYGSYALAEPWPARIDRERTVYVDQFSGKTLATSTPGDWGQGQLGTLTEFGVQTHMGTQFGIVSRIVMTLGCLTVLWSVFSATMMYTRRRRPGTAGLPRRPRDVRMAKKLLVMFAMLSLVYPLWGASLVLIVLFDRLVIRQVPKLRVAFGMRA
jgi:uncharacterized iron-regulated membrane protein